MTIINWTLAQYKPDVDLQIIAQFADPRTGAAPSRQLTERLRDAISRFPCDILFIHRDAEREPSGQRRNEIETAIAILAVTPSYYVPVIPVRMTEAWLLIDEEAIRRAADNPNGSVRLALPQISRLEFLPDPKESLNRLLVEASEKTGRRLAKFKQIPELAWRRGRVAELIEDYTPLRSLDAFKAFEAQSIEALRQWIAAQSEADLDHTSGSNR